MWLGSLLLRVHDHCVFQPPTVSGCDSLERTEILYGPVTSQDNHNTVIDPGETRVFLPVVDPGQYMIVVRLTNNDGLASDSDVTVTVPGKK